MESEAKVILLNQRSFSGKILRRPTNAEVRSREYLTEDEVQVLPKSVQYRQTRSPRCHPNLVAYPHALRVSELVSLRWEQVNLRQGLLHVTRRNSGTPSTNPLRGRAPWSYDAIKCA